MERFCGYHHRKAEEIKHNVKRMSSGGLDAPTFRKAKRLKRELNLNINTNTAITYTHCCTSGGGY